MANASEISIVCRYAFRIFKNDTFSTCRFEYVEKPADVQRRDFIAKGNNLPEVKGTPITLYGRWVKDKEGRTAFQVSSYSMELPSTEEGVVEYMKYLKCGIGQERAHAIYDKFKENVWYICRTQPERLKEVNGLSERNIQKLIARLKETRTQMEVLQMFRGANISFSKINRLVDTFGPATSAILKDNPYVIARMDGFSFSLADSLALGQGMDPVHIERRKAAILAALDQAALNGHVCLPREELITKAMRLLDCVKYQELTREMCDIAIVANLSEKKIASTSGYIYTIERYHQEKRIVSELMRLMNAPCKTASAAEIEQIIDQYETENSIKLAESQRAAVVCAVSHPVCIMTGGPGTGKSTTAKAILYCQNVLMEGKSSPILLSPTGKAARRLAESTGYGASTIHSGIQLRMEESVKDVDEDGCDSKQEYLSGDIILVDESSMADQTTVCELVCRVPTGCKLVFIGDPDQLPSVGCGNILADLIRSQVIPTVKLSVIFRQAGDNPIVTNSMRIKEGETDLLYNQSFVLMPMDDPERIFMRAAHMYVESVKKYGLDSTILLCPYRNSTSLNVNRFNIELQKILNPVTPATQGRTMTGKSVFISANKSVPVEFRIGDKVMQTVNTDIAKNGDTGYIKDIVYVNDSQEGTGSKKVAKVEFNGDGVIHLLDLNQIRDLDLAYCSTIHKSQGEEYTTVIMVMSTAHKQMLQRNLFYTGITRAKKNVLLVGEAAAISDAIQNNSITKRYTLLADRLYAIQQKRAA